MSQQTQTTLDIEKIIATRQDPAAPSAAAPSSLDYGEVAVDINGVLRTGNKNGQVVTHVVSTDDRLTDTRNPRVTALTNQNLNDITTPGFYYAGGNNTVVNKPSGVNAFGLLVERTSFGFFAQTLTSADQMNGKIFFRQISGGTTWTAWSSFYTTVYKPTPAEIGAARAYSSSYSFGGSQTGITTAQFIDLLESLGAFNEPYWVARGSWIYAGNKYITDTGFGNVHLAGTVVEVIGNSIGYTIRLTLPTTSGLTSLLGCELVYINNGDAYKPGWRKVYSSLNKPTPSEIGALPLSGGTMTGSLKLKGDPTESLEAATKAYVDRQIGESGSGDMRKAVYDTDNDGVVDKAEKLGTARTITLGTAAAATATPFDGSQNITIPVTLVREAYLSWGGKSLSGSITPIDCALADFASGNRLFGTPASSISIEVSRNGGNTWSAYPGITDGGKRSLVSTETSFTLGGVGSGNTVQDQLRVTISADSFYFSCRKVLMNVSTNRAGMKVNIKYSTIGTPDTFKDYGTFSLSGWPGWNSIPLSMAWGGYSNQPDQAKKVQFTFSMTGAGPAAVFAIYAYGENAWVSPNVMAKYGRSYDVDYDCNSTFRGKVTLKQDPSSNLEAATKQYVDKGAISTYTHSKSGTVHTLTGSGDNIRFIATADFTSGDTFKIGATSVTAKTIGGDSLWTGFFKNGAVVTCYKNGTTINFNGGGLPASELAKLTPGNIKTGISITANGKTVAGTFTSDGTAESGHLLKGKIAYVKGQKITGTMANNAYRKEAEEISLAEPRLYYHFKPGYYADGGNSEVKLFAQYSNVASAIGLTPEKIKKGERILGVTGSLAAPSVITGQQIYNDYGLIISGGELGIISIVSDNTIVKNLTTDQNFSSINFRLVIPSSNAARFGMSFLADSGKAGLEIQVVKTYTNYTPTISILGSSYIIETRMGQGGIDADIKVLISGTSGLISYIIYGQGMAA